jgi:adenylate cyclase
MLNFYVATKKGSTRFDHGDGPIEFGREPREGTFRYLIRDPYVSGDQLRVVECPGSRVRLENLSRRVAVSLANGESLDPKETGEFTLPIRLKVGESLIEITQGVKVQLDEHDLRTIAQPITTGSLLLSRALPGLEDSPTAEQLTRWFEAVITVQRAATASEEFYRETARAVVDLVGLDVALVLMRQEGDWQVVARQPEHAPAVGEFSRTILDRVCREKRTFFQTATQIDTSHNPTGISAIVASPVFGSDSSEVIGAVYGARMSQNGRSAPEIRPIEAQLIQVLATAVGAGLARMESEAEASRQHAQFAQFFSRELAYELERDPRLLEGRDRVVTILLSDMRDFSWIAERIGPREACDLIVEILEQFTARIQEHGGIVVDYLGDGLLAMWNAPIERDDHALRACRAALAMIGDLPSLNARWEGRIGAPLRLGVGLNTGEALVGNIGSRRKFKYGPLGHMVYLASRVEGATKQLGVPILITDSTRRELGGALATRRLGRFRVAGLAGGVELHELARGEATPEWLAFRDTYENALAAFEEGRWDESCRLLYHVFSDPGTHDDLPTLNLASRSIECLRYPDRPFEAVVDLGR